MERLGYRSALDCAIVLYRGTPKPHSLVSNIVISVIYQ